MKKIIFIWAVLYVFPQNLIWANKTRMVSLGVQDYLDDVINITRYPSQIMHYPNFLYGDIGNRSEDYGIIIAPEPNFGRFGIWQLNQFNLGYGINIHKFDIGISGSPVHNQRQFAIGLSYHRFAGRCDLGIRFSDSLYTFGIRSSQRKGDFSLNPKYSFTNYRKPYKYFEHRLGILLQRFILSEGYVYLGAEYNPARGDIENDISRIYTGLELALSNRIMVRCGATEKFKDKFERPEWQLETGIGITVRGIRFDCHLNKARLFDKELTIFNLVGFELDFGRF